MKKILVAGATGNLGRAVVAELGQRGYWIRTLVRDAGKLNGLSQKVDDVFRADARRENEITGACQDVDVVFSALGAPLSFNRSAKGVTYRSVDYAGNKHLLDEARRAGVKKFVYVSLCGAHMLADCEYVRAHEDFVRELAASGLCHTIVRPTGFFSAMSEIVRLARLGIVVSIGDGSHRTNPIHEADLAIACADAIEDIRREITIGGPETYTRREITELAFESLGLRPRIVSLPAKLIKRTLAPVKLFDERLHSLLHFLISVQGVDAVAPPIGTHSLKDYYRAVARNLNH